jgi:outer membrane lipoprotein
MFPFMAALLSACASTLPFSKENLVEVDPNLTPEQAVEENEHDTQVLWGGTIISTENEPEQTTFSVLYYPLDKSQRPNLGKKPLNRFKVKSPGYSETMVYTPGREITVLGNLQGIEDGKVGDAPYRFPVIKAVKVYLWPQRLQQVDDSNVHFGVGVGIGIH